LSKSGETLGLYLEPPTGDTLIHDHLCENDVVVYHETISTYARARSTTNGELLSLKPSHHKQRDRLSLVMDAIDRMLRLRLAERRRSGGR
jgi:hypothetical protein